MRSGVETPPSFLRSKQNVTYIEPDYPRLQPNNEVKSYYDRRYRKYLENCRVGKGNLLREDFIDQTLFLKEILDDTRQIFILSYPQWVDTNHYLSMLKEFCNSQDAKKLFTNTKIASDKKFCDNHLAKYTVLDIDLSELQTCRHMSEIYDKIVTIMSDLCTSINIDRKEFINNPCFRSEQSCQYSLKEVCKMLQKRAQGKGKKKQIIICVRDVDGPVLNTLMDNKFQERYSAFIKQFVNLKQIESESNKLEITKVIFSSSFLVDGSIAASETNRAHMVHALYTHALDKYILINENDYSRLMAQQKIPSNNLTICCKIDQKNYYYPKLVHDMIEARLNLSTIKSATMMEIFSDKILQSVLESIDDFIKLKNQLCIEDKAHIPGTQTYNLVLKLKDIFEFEWWEEAYTYPNKLTNNCDKILYLMIGYGLFYLPRENKQKKQFIISNDIARGCVVELLKRIDRLLEKSQHTQDRYDAQRNKSTSPV